MDPRRDVSIKQTNTASLAAATLFFYPKFIPTVNLVNDSESDWPILRYADVLLMLAEAQGNSMASVDLINQVRSRVNLTPITVTTDVDFTTKLFDERRLEFGCENQRWFDLLRLGNTQAEALLEAHFDNMDAQFYSRFNPPTPLNEIKTNCNSNRFLLPIPRQEILSNTTITIDQNPGY
jgi:hypothetical protein